jgi:DnaA family protein
VNDPREPGRQLPLAWRYPPDQRLATFIAAPNGLLAQLQALAGAGGDWLYLQGADGTGKTHLALATCAAAEAAGRLAAYVPLATARGRLRAALDALDGNDLAALDGLESIAGVDEDERALFDFHNRARAAGMTIVYAAQVAPDALPLRLPDLHSRLSQCTRITLRGLDDEGRRAVLRDRANRRGLELDAAALDWLLLRVDRNVGELAGLLDRLDRESLAAQRRITVPFLRQVLEQDR